MLNVSASKIAGAITALSFGIICNLVNASGNSTSTGSFAQKQLDVFVTSEVAKFDQDFTEYQNSKIQVKKITRFEDVTLEKPIEYTVEKGDTLESLGSKYSIDPRYIIESNKDIIYGKIDKNSPNFVEQGQVILIPHKTGVAYKVKKGESKIDIMKKFNFGIKTWDKYNDIVDPQEGDIIVFPISNQHLEGSGKNLSEFFWGNCTWYVAERLKGYINWGGNANEWLANAKKAGNDVDDIPAINSVIVMGEKGMPLGHVGVVESFTETEVNISEMNYTGLGKKSFRKLPRDHHSIKGYIHTQKSIQ